jgi:hypothetical protein
VQRVDVPEQPASESALVASELGQACLRGVTKSCHECGKSREHLEEVQIYERKVLQRARAHVCLNLRNARRSFGLSEMTMLGSACQQRALGKWGGFGAEKTTIKGLAAPARFGARLESVAPRWDSGELTQIEPSDRLGSYLCARNETTTTFPSG